MTQNREELDDPLDQKLKVSRARKLVAQGKLDGTYKPTYQTEAELQGYRATQMPLGIGNGERPMEDLPMFGGDLPTERDLCRRCGAMGHDGPCEELKEESDGE